MEYLNFSQIELTGKECAALEASVKGSTPIEECRRLLRLGLVVEERRPVPGYAGEPLGTCRATNFGRDYLVWLKNRSRVRRWENVRYAITTGIALCALIKAWLPEIHAAMAILWTR